MKIHAWCDKFELRDLLEKRRTPHFYRQPFWHGDGSPSVRVTITWNKQTARIKRP